MSKVIKRVLNAWNYPGAEAAAETQSFLDERHHNPSKAMSLFVPDGSRRIFDTEEKYEGLKTFSIEMDDLAKEAAIEQSYLINSLRNPTMLANRKVLRETYVPG